jgi:hypothetical protein
MKRKEEINIEFIFLQGKEPWKNRKGCELMRLLDLQPKKNFSYIFVQFPGMKMNLTMLSSDEGKVVNEDIALCVQLNRKQKVTDVFLVRTQSIKPFDFTDEGIGAKAFYRVIKKKETSQDSHTNESEEIVTNITDEVAIVQKKTTKGYTFVLVFKGHEKGIIASIEEKVQRVEKASLRLIEEDKEPAAARTNDKKNMIVFRRRIKKRLSSGGQAFQDNEVFERIRIRLEEGKRRVAIFSPAALDFIGPGDQNQTIFIMRGGC